MPSRYDPSEPDPALRHGWRTDPKSKADLMDRILDESFSGDLRDLAAEPETLQVKRLKDHMVELKFKTKTFLLALHIPKPEKARQAARDRMRKAMAEGLVVYKKIAGTPKKKAVKAVAGGRKPKSRY